MGEKGDDHGNVFISHNKCLNNKCLKNTKLQKLKVIETNINTLLNQKPNSNNNIEALKSE